MKETAKAKVGRRNPFQCTDAEALQAYETALQNFSKHAHDKIEAYKKEVSHV